MCVAFGSQLNSVTPISDLQSERIEIRKDRFIRIVHLKSKLSWDNSDQGSRDDVHSVSGESANSNAPVVVFFIHGVGGCADLWYEQLIYFCSAGYDVVAPDLLGHGGSSAPRDQRSYSFSELSDDMITLFDRYRKKRNVLIGHSYGASFCTYIAAERARFVSKMVLVSGGGPIPLRPDSYHLFCLPTPILSCMRPLLLCTFERKAYHRNTARAIVKKHKSFSAPPYVLKATMEGQIWEEGDEGFHTELLVPALLIYGAQDQFVTLEEEQWMLGVIYSSSLEVIQDAGHMVMIECPEKVNWLIHNFLQRDPTTRSKESVHVQFVSSKRMSLAVESLSRFPVNHEAIHGRRPSDGCCLDSRSDRSKDAQFHTRMSLSVPGNLGSNTQHEFNETSKAGHGQHLQGTSDMQGQQISLETNGDVGMNKIQRGNHKQCRALPAYTKVSFDERIPSTTAPAKRPSSAHSARPHTKDSDKEGRSTSRSSLKAWLSPKWVRRKGLDHGSSQSVPTSPARDSTEPKVEC